MTPAAQRLLLVDELLNLIISQLVALGCSGKSCLAVALTCTQLYNPAMDALWYHVDTLNRFKSCIPDGPCQCGDSELTQEGLGHPVHTEVRPPAHSRLTHS